MITKDIQEIAESENLAALGFAPASEMDGEPAGYRPQDALPGARVFGHIRGYISMARNDGQPILEVLYLAMTGTQMRLPFCTRNPMFIPDNLRTRP